jgi:hypothetical protein
MSKGTAKAKGKGLRNQNALLNFLLAHRRVPCDQSSYRSSPHSKFWWASDIGCYRISYDLVSSDSPCSLNDRQLDLLS